MNYKTLKNTARSCALALSILGSSFLLPGCTFTNANAKVESVQEAKRDFYERHSGLPKPDGGVYSGDFSNYFPEERIIKNISREGDKVSYTISNGGFEYARNNNCGLEAYLVDTSDPNARTRRADIPVDLNGNTASFIVPNDNKELRNLRAGIFCTENGSRVLLASYPLGVREIYSGDNAQEAPEPTKQPTSAENAYVPVGEQRNLPLVPGSLNDKFEQIKIGEKQEKLYQAEGTNTSDKYSLKTNCGEVQSITDFPSDSFGIVPITSDMSCEVSLIGDENRFVSVNFEPEHDKESVVSSLSEDMRKLTVSFKEPGKQYIVIAETENPADKDYLVFDVSQRLEIAKQEEQKETADQLTGLFSNLYNDNDVLNAKIFYRYLPLNKWKELELKTAENDFSDVKRLRYKEGKPYLIQTKKSKELFIPNIANLKITPEEGYSLNILKVVESTDKELPSNDYYFVFTNEKNNDTDFVHVKTYLDRFAKQARGSTLIGPFVKKDFFDRSLEFEVDSVLGIDDYSNYLSWKYGVGNNREREVQAGLRALLGLKYKNIESHGIQSVKLYHAENLEALLEEDSYIIELRYEGLIRPILVDYGNLERLLLPNTHRLKDHENVRRHLKSNDFVLGNDLYVELFADPDFEEVKGAARVLMIAASTGVGIGLAGASGAASAGSSSGSAGTINGGNML